MPTPSFFDHLDLAPTSDIRQIKRAYAVALKRIDQDSEREAFEALRTAYGRALAWAEWAQDDTHANDDAGEWGNDPEDDDAEGEDLEDEDLENEDNEADDGADRDGRQRSADHEGWRPSAARSDVHPAEDARDDGDRPDAALPDPVTDQRAFAPPPARETAPSPDSNLGQSAALDRAAEQAALEQWAARLLAAGPSADAMLPLALADSRLSHLESRSRLEAMLADGLYREPDERQVLFDACAASFGWDERNARAGGGWAAADWVQQVVNEGLLWDDQSVASKMRQRAALDAIAATTTPTDAQVQYEVPVLKMLQSSFGAWLALRVPASRQDAWTRHWKAPEMDTFDLMPGESLHSSRIPQPGTGALLRRLVKVVLGVLFGVTALTFVVWTLLPRHEPAEAATATATASAQAPVTDEPPPLAFEFTGPIDRDSCEMAHEFVHESNWLTIDDVDAISLLATRAMQCQDKKLWPAVVDPLMACLRAERAAALAAGRPERSAQCETTAK